VTSIQAYEGQQFGDFRIMRRIGGGAEAEVYEVGNEETGQVLILRLNVNDNTLWGDTPVNPPVNASLEIPNVRGTFFGKLAYTSVNGKHLTPGKSASSFWSSFRHEPKMTISSPDIFGVKDNKYLIPVASPFMVLGSVPMEKLLQIGTLDAFYKSELWKDIADHFVSEISVTRGRISEQAWQSRWRPLLGSARAAAELHRYMASQHISSELRGAILSHLLSPSMISSELAENLIVRLWIGVLSGCITINDAKATINSRDFRRNITGTDMSQFLAIFDIFGPTYDLRNKHRNMVFTMLKEFAKQPYDFVINPELFSYVSPDPKKEEFSTFIERHNLQRFTLFLQEHAGRQQKFVSLELELMKS
jgi:hypothetical protein